MRFCFSLLFIIITFGSLYGNTVSVKVFDNESKRPIPNVVIGIREFNSIEYTDKDGVANHKNIERGFYELEIIHPEYIKKEITIKVRRKFYLEVLLDKKEDILLSENNSYGSLNSHEKNQSITYDDIKTFPMRGAGDSLHLLQSLPGVGGSFSMASVPIIRGSNPINDKYYIDGIPVDSPYHFIASMVPIMSAINEEVIDTATILKGPYPLHYDDSVGSIIDIKTKEVDTPGVTTKIILDPFIPGLPTLFATIVPTKDLSIMFAGRRSTLDLVRGIVDRNILPDYIGYIGDHYLKVSYNISDKHRLRFITFGSDSYQRTPDFESKSQFHVEALQWDFLVSKKLLVNTSLSGYVLNQRLQVHDLQGLFLKYKPYQIRLNQMANLNLNPFYVKAGYEYIYHGNGVSSNLSILNFSNNDIFDQNTTSQSVSSLIEGHSLSIFAETGIEVDSIWASVGFRYKYYGPLDEKSFSVKGSLGYNVTDNTMVYAGSGLYHSNPSVQYYMGYRNPNYRSNRAYLTNLGIKSKPLPWLLCQVEAYYNYYDHLTTIPGLTLESTELKTYTQMHPFADEQEGSTMGVEISLKGKYKVLQGKISYAYSYSKRNSNNNLHGEYPSDFNQPHILRVAIAARFKKWVPSMIWHLYSPLPHTSIVDRTIGSRNYEPVFYGYNNRREGVNHRLDLKLTYHYSKDFKLYGEIWNVYYNQNNYVSQNFEALNLQKPVQDFPPLFIWIGMEICL